MMTITPTFLMAIALGGALGALARFFTQHYISLWLGLQFPWGTLVANVLGCFILGLLTGFWANQIVPLSPEIRGVIVIGFLGAFTTFSAFSLDTLVLFQSGDVLRALMNVCLNIILCLFAVGLGYWLTRSTAAIT